MAGIAHGPPIPEKDDIEEVIHIFIGCITVGNRFIACVRENK